MTDKKAEKKIKKWINEAIAMTNATIDDQKEYVRNKVMENNNIKEALLENAIEVFCFQYLYASRHETKKQLNRDCIRAKGANPTQSNVTQQTELAFRRRLKKTIFDEYDCGDKKIGDCTRDEVAREATRLRNTGKGYIEQANIFTDVCNLMTSNKKTVRQCIKSVTFISIVNKYKAMNSIA